MEEEEALPPPGGLLSTGRRFCSDGSVFPFVLHPCVPTQLVGNSQLHNAVSGDEDGVKKSAGGNSCEDDEEGHLIYHIGLLMKGRCM